MREQRHQEPSSAATHWDAVDEIDTTKLPAIASFISIDQIDTAKLPAVFDHAPAADAPTLAQSIQSPRQSLSQRLLAHFVVESSSGDSLSFIDGLRAIACLAVVVVHARTRGDNFLLPLPLPGTPSGTGLDFGPIISSGFVGVELFFVLSGFLLALTWIRADLQGKPRPSWKRYAQLRIARIVPAYYVCLGAVIILGVPTLIKPPLVYSPVGGFTVATHLLFIHFLFPVSSASFGGVVGQFWTLSIEAIWYVLLPFTVAWFFRRRWVLALPVSALISIVWQTLVQQVLAPGLVPHIVSIAHRVGAPWYSAGDAYMYVQNQFPAHVFDFALGITVANLFLRRQLHPRAERWSDFNSNRSNRWHDWFTSRAAGTVYLLVGVLLVVVPMYAINPTMPFLHLGTQASSSARWLPAPVAHDAAVYFEDFVSLGFALILAGALFGGGWIRAVLSIMPLRILGILSYSIYLFHLPILRNIGTGLFMHTSTTMPDLLFLQYFGATMAETVAVAIVVYLFIEKPFIVRARHGRSRRSGTQPASVTGL